MRKAAVFVNSIKAGELVERVFQTGYEFNYDPHYQGPLVSLTLPLKKANYTFQSFPAVFEGLLPEGVQLEALLRDKKINRRDLFSQLIVCGSDCVGALTVKELL